MGTNVGQNTTNKLNENNNNQNAQTETKGGDQCGSEKHERTKSKELFWNDKWKESCVILQHWYESAVPNFLTEFGGETAK